jgi:TonB-linked SusC/RagA family outer membrane protein
MQKERCCKSGKRLRRIPSKVPSLSKLGILLFIFLAELQVSASAIPKKISLTVKNAPIEHVIKLIQKQSGYQFIYNNELLGQAKPVSLNISDGTLEMVLSKCFEGQPLTYELVEKAIVVKAKKVQEIPQIEAKQQTLIKEVKGKVTDERGEGLPGVNIQVKGTGQGGTTDVNGFFNIEVLDERAVLVFSYVGYLAQEITVGSRSSLEIALRVDEKALEEIVVVGYGTQKKSELTGAIATISPSDFNKIPVHNPLNALQGRLPGLHITVDGTPGGGTRSVNVRGFNTLGSTSPLFIIDGQPVNGYQGSQALDFLNPNDIETIQVLKDGSAASIYGSRASAGVIIITTKKGKGAGKVEINSSATLQSFYNKPQMLNAEQRGITYWRASLNDGVDPNKDNPHYTYSWDYDAAGNPRLNDMKVVEWLDPNLQGGIRAGNTNWFKEISRPGLITQNNATVSKGDKDYSVVFSLGHHYHRGAIKYTDFQRTTARVNTSVDLFNGRLSIGENFQFVTSERVPMGEGQGGSTYGLGFISSPLIPVYAEDGSFAGPAGPGMPNRQNPLQVASLAKENRSNMRQAFGNAFLKFKILPNLLLQSNFGIDYRDREHLTYVPTFQAGFLKEERARYSRNLPQDKSWTWSNTLNYDIERKSHHIKLLAGMEAISHVGTEFFAQREGYIIENPNYMNIGSGTGLFAVSGSETGHQLLSYFGKANYSYESKYLLSSTVRYDGSSRFGEGSRFGFFPAASMGWRISAEPFWDGGVDFVSNLLVRAGFGRTGNQEIGNNASYGLFRPAYDIRNNHWQRGAAYDINGANSGTLPSGVIAVQLANPNLRWEQTDEVNVGLDFDIKRGVLTGSFDVFTRNTSDILVNPPYLAVSGEGGSQWQNGATMKNRGWELQLGYNKMFGNLSFTSNLSVASFRDKVTYVPEASIRAYPGNVEKTIIGRSIRSLFGYVTDGIFQDEKEVAEHANQSGKRVGRIRYSDLNKDGIINELDQTWLGTSIPDFEYGLNLVFGFKQFTLTAFFQGVQGMYLNNQNETQNVLIGSTLAGQNQTTRALNAWTPENRDSKIPALSKLDDNNESRPSDFMIQNASYLKLRNLMLGYNIPVKTAEKLKLKNAQIYLQASELFTLHSKDWSGTDPENPAAYYPLTRGITFGVNLTF